MYIYNNVVNEKMKVSQDTLYKYLTEHDVIFSRLAEMMDMSPDTVSACFIHSANRHGTPRCFTVENIQKLNNALLMFAHKLRSCLLRFGTEQVYTNKHGRTYDPGMIEPINRLGDYLNTTALFGRMLGWSKGKKRNVFSAPTSKNYGNISQDDVDVLNVEIMSVAGFLENVEVVPDENAFDGNSNSSKE